MRIDVAFWKIVVDRKPEEGSTSESAREETISIEVSISTTEL